MTADPAGPSLLYAVKQVELAVRAHLDELLRPSGITALQYTALTVLARRAGLTSAELARNAFVTPQSMGDLVTALERRQLVATSTAAAAPWPTARCADRVLARSDGAGQLRPASSSEMTSSAATAARACGSNSA